MKLKILLCIDDTDDILKKENTGKIARYIVKNIMYNKYGETLEVTKHKLLKEKGINYTYNNESICIEANVKEEEYMEVINDAKDIIKENMSSDSNPGICVIMMDKVFNKEEIIDFGLKAEKEIINKKDASMLALKSGIYLKEVSGSGDGIIGALAGAALKLNGSGEVYSLEEE